MIEQYLLDFTYRRESGLWTINDEDIKLPEGMTVRDKQIVCIPSGGFGGNHKHPRTEAFIGLGEGLSLIWEDNDGTVHELPMNAEDKIKLFVVKSMTPHVVINRGKETTYLYEMADAKQYDVEPYDVLSKL